jgi:hypothetical protein
MFSRKSSPWQLVTEETAKTHAHVPFMLIHQQMGKPATTKIAVFITTCMALCPMKNCATISLTISLCSSVISASTFYSL